MARKYYITPDQFMGALSDAIREAYYREEWDKPQYPQDIAYNVAHLAEGLGAFMGSLIYHEYEAEKKRLDGLNRLLTTIRDMPKQDEPDYDYSQLNDAFVQGYDE